MRTPWKYTLLCLLLAGLTVCMAVLSACDKEEASSVPAAEESAEFPAPDFTVLDENGQRVKLSDYKGKPIVLNFWATWCYYCKDEMPDFQRAYELYPDVQFLMVNVQESVETATAYTSSQGFTFPLLFDTKGEAAGAYGVTGFPTTVFLNSKGELVTVGRGMLDYDSLIKGIGMIRE